MGEIQYNHGPEVIRVPAMYSSPNPNLVPNANHNLIPSLNHHYNDVKQCFPKDLSKMNEHV